MCTHGRNPKSNGKVRVCVDLKKIDEYVKRENHPLSAADTNLGRLAGSRIFTKLDANLDVLQIKLDFESRPLTMFVSATISYPLAIVLVQEKCRRSMYDSDPGGISEQHRWNTTYSILGKRNSEFSQQESNRVCMCHY